MIKNKRYYVNATLYANLSGQCIRHIHLYKTYNKPIFSKLNQRVLYLYCVQDKERKQILVLHRKTHTN